MTSSLPTIHLWLSADGTGHQRIDPANPTASAYGGGSRSGFMGLVRALGRLSKYDVTAISTFTQREQIVDGVRYLRIDNARAAGTPDICFAFYDCSPIAQSQARLKIASHHTLVPFNPSWPYPHVNTAPSQYTVDKLRENYRPNDVWYVLPNAVEGLEGVEWRPVPGRCLFHTSPDRGLHLLLEAWPEIRDRVPHATLHIGGDPKDTIREGLHYGQDGAYESRRGFSLSRHLEAAERAGGVKLIGRLPREELLREISEAACFPFPAEMSVPSETFSVSILECCTIGVPVVLSPADALESVYRDSGVLMTRAPANRYLHEFADGVVKMLTDPAFAQETSKREREWSKRFSFDKSAATLHRIIERNLLKAVG